MGNPVSGLIEGAVTASVLVDLGLLVAGQLSDVEVGWDIVLAYQMRPYVEEFAMTDSRERRGERIDVAGVPVRGSRNTGVASPAVFVNAGDDAMIAILEAGIDGVNMRSRGQGAIQQVVALIGTKILRIGSRHLGDKAQKAFGTFDQIMGALDADLAGLRDRVMQDRDHSGRIPVVIVDQDENKNGNAEADEKQRHDQAQPRSPDPGEQRRCCLLDQGTVQEAATAMSEKGQHRNRPSNQQGR